MKNYDNNKMTIKEFRTAINESLNWIIKEDREKNIKWFKYRRNRKFIF